VVAIYTRGLGFAATTLRRRPGPHTAGLVQFVLLRATPAARAGVERVLGGLAPGASALSRTDYQVTLDQGQEAERLGHQVVVGVLLVYVASRRGEPLATWAAMGRRRELATLRLSGTTAPQILRMVRIEQGCCSASGWSSAGRSRRPP